MNAAEDECVAMPDPASLVVLPWDRRVAWMSADLLVRRARAVRALPPARSSSDRSRRPRARVTTSSSASSARSTWCARTRSAGPVTSTPLTRSGSLKPTPAYDIEVSLDALGLLDEMVATLDEAGFEVFSFDAEGGDGQYEFDFQHRSALDMADKVAFFRVAAKQIAKQHGLVATFMPKPYAEAWGSGAHYNMSLADIESGANLFRDPDDARGRGWSKTAYGFVAGILRHAPALSAICAPTVNSYKRLTERLADGTNSWAPVWATYGDNNRSCLLRLPRNRPVRREPRCRLGGEPVPRRRVPARRRARRSARAAGSRAIRWRTSPTTGRHGAIASGRLPRTLLEAIDAFEADPLVASVFPAQFVTRVRRDEARGVGRVPRAGHRVGAHEVLRHVLSTTATRQSSPLPEETP